MMVQRLIIQFPLYYLSSPLTRGFKTREVILEDWSLTRGVRNRSFRLYYTNQRFDIQTRRKGLLFIGLVCMPYSVADPDLELSGGGGGGAFDLLAMAAIFPSVISSFLTQNKGGGGPGAPGPSPRSATVIKHNNGCFICQTDRSEISGSTRGKWTPFLYFPSPPFFLFLFRIPLLGQRTGLLKMERRISVGIFRPK